jgi:hypothetical protein
MPKPKPIAAYGQRRESLTEFAEEREILDPAEMMYSTVEKIAAGEVALDPEIASHAGSTVYQSEEGVEGEQAWPAAQPGQAFVGSSMSSSMAEKSISEMLDVRDQLTTTFGQVSQDPRLAAIFTGCIRKVEAAVKSLGAEVTEFNPERFASGLNAVPRGNLLDNALRVVENTKTLYSMYPIEKIYAGPDKASGRPGVAIILAGEKNGSKFRVQGKIVAPVDFNGTEAVDFIKDAEKGILSVKEPKKGVWTDVSDDFSVAWQLLPPEEGKENAPVE